MLHSRNTSEKRGFPTRAYYKGKCMKEVSLKLLLKTQRNTNAFSKQILGMFALSIQTHWAAGSGHTKRRAGEHRHVPLQQDRGTPVPAQMSCRQTSPFPHCCHSPPTKKTSCRCLLGQEGGIGLSTSSLMPQHNGESGHVQCFPMQSPRMKAVTTTSA